MTRQQVLTLAEHVDERLRLARRNRLIRAVCASLAALCVATAGLGLLPGIQAQRRELQLVVGENAFDDAPPDIALPSAMLSTFRGLMIHFLWTRAERLKSENKYFELQQLYDWICNLQPRYPKVWGNAAWNLAYNVSVGTFSSRERWFWVSSGAYLLRDKGIPQNPTTMDLYKELAWIFEHKMGDFMDDHHWDYKRNWAVIMELILGQPPTEEDDEVVLAGYRRIAAAAEAIRKFDALGKPEALQMYIASDTASPSMSDVVSRLAEVGLGPDADWLAAIAKHDRRGIQLSDLVAEGAAGGAATADPSARERIERFKAIMKDGKLAPARDRLLAAVRAHVLARDQKLDPSFMVKLMERYGVVDWRSVYSEGLYWSALGAEKCVDTIGKDENVEMNIHRFIQFALKDSCERGGLIFEPNFDDPFASFIALLPDYRFTETLHQLYLEQAEALRGNEDPAEYYKEGPAGRLFKSGHVNFLQTAVRELYLEGRMEQANKYYAYLRDNYKEPDGRTKDMYLTTIEEFALKDYFEDLDSFKQGPVLIHTMLHSAYLNLAYLRPQEAARRMAFAKMGYDRYMSSKLMDRNERRKIPDWPKLKASAFEDFLLHYPLPRDYNVVYKARTWAQLRDSDNQTLLEIYDRVAQPLAQLCAENKPPLDPSKAFPPPAGLEEFRARRKLEQEKELPERPGNVGEVDVEQGTGR